jgi:hypothetical protein
MGKNAPNAKQTHLQILSKSSHEDAKNFTLLSSQRRKNFAKYIFIIIP